VTTRRLPTARDALLPTWLLPVPQPLTMRGHRPCYQGELELLIGPQRLELAHWPGEAAHASGGEPGDVRVGGQADALPTLRDYFVARSPIAGLLWVFRQQGVAESEPAWFLHGRFA
jgi:protein ImuB